MKAWKGLDLDAWKMGKTQKQQQKKKAMRCCSKKILLDLQADLFSKYVTLPEREKMTAQYQALST